MLTIGFLPNNTIIIKERDLDIEFTRVRDVILDMMSNEGEKIPKVKEVILLESNNTKEVIKTTIEKRSDFDE